MTTTSNPEIDWSLTTWKGSRRKQHEEFRAIPFSRKLEIIEEMNRFAKATMERRRNRGQAYIDPYTGERVTSAMIQEAPPSEAGLAPAGRATRSDSSSLPIPSRAQIEDFARRVAEEFQPERIILFGSHAYGTPTEDSDVDLLVVMPHEDKAFKMASRIRLRVRAPFPMDLMVRSPAEIEHRRALEDFFIEEIISRGEVLYERDDAGMGS